MRSPCVSFAVRRCAVCVTLAVCRCVTLAVCVTPSVRVRHGVGVRVRHGTPCVCRRVSVRHAVGACAVSVLHGALAVSVSVCVPLAVRVVRHGRRVRVSPCVGASVCVILRLPCVSPFVGALCVCARRVGERQGAPYRCARRVAVCVPFAVRHAVGACGACAVCVTVSVRRCVPFAVRRCASRCRCVTVRHDTPCVGGVCARRHGAPACRCVSVSVCVALRRCVPFAVRHAVGACGACAVCVTVSVRSPYRSACRRIGVRVVRRALAVSVCARRVGERVPFAVRHAVGAYRCRYRCRYRCV